MSSTTEYLRELFAQNRGTVTVERFMREALYHPQFGYYTRRVRGIGREGDFSTSVTLHPALPQAIARWAVAHRPEVSHGGRWHLIELGGGNGQMAEGVLNGLGLLGHLGLRYHLVEVSEPLRAVQQRHLRRFAGRVHWHAEMADAMNAAGGRALIFSNEFVDAFPCVRLVRDAAAESGWREVALHWPADLPAPRETLVAWQPADDAWRQCSAARLEDLPASLPPHQWIEVHLAYARWLQTWLAGWQLGRMLTIDYGDEFPGLYDRQPKGTIRGYAHHQRITGPDLYRHFGQQDLTADVNFTDLRNWSLPAVKDGGQCSTQADFLQKWLPRKWLKPTRGEASALAYLLDKSGAGNAFKVLEQRKS